jgi:hypothetical protein
MNLVDYSDSESSDSDEERIGAPPPAPKPHHATLPPKPTKKQIIVDLPKPSRADDDDEPLKKRPRPNGQGGGGLFSILPPPKRSKPSTNGAPKPVQPEVQSVDTSGELIEPVETETPPAKLITTTSFMPRSTQAKRKAAQPKQSEPAAKPAPISLFPLGPDLISKPYLPTTTSTPSTYEPLITKPLPQDPFPATDDTNYESPFIPDTTAPPPSTMSTADLDSFAAHILEGRHRKNRTINIMDFNAGEQYAQNAADKASGALAEQVAPVRAIGSGRHQLSQLLNNVQDQKESLEEAFARGRQVKKESGAKYGW